MCDHKWMQLWRSGRNWEALKQQLKQMQFSSTGLVRAFHLSTTWHWNTSFPNSWLEDHKSWISNQLLNHSRQSQHQLPTIASQLYPPMAATAMEHSTCEVSSSSYSMATVLLADYHIRCYNHIITY